MLGIDYGFLPVSTEEVKALGWDQYDFLLVSGDAYVDHPSFGAAIIGRVLEAEGYRVVMLPQPDWHSKDDFIKFGRPRLGVMISGGNIDSMVNHYTAAKKRRSEDLYSNGGEAGHRPDRCTIVYSNRIREAFGDIPLIVGGLEASLRRFAHYDYWDNKVRHSLIVDSQADIICYGMGERSTVEIANALNAGVPISDINYVSGTVYKTSEPPKDSIELESFEEVSTGKTAYAKAMQTEYNNQDPFKGKTLCQKHGKIYVVQNPPSKPLSQSEMDRVYALPYTRSVHPMYKDGVPAIEEVKFSITSSRGCFGACNFCALTFHQGRIIQARSHKSIINEAKNMTYDPDFKGYIHDVGGPTANFRTPACDNQLKHGACIGKQCLFPQPCKNLKIDHTDYINLLRKLRAIDGVKRVFIRSGIRYDYLIHDKNDEFFKELCKYHVSGQLKVAPEHVSERVLKAMGKPPVSVYEKFRKKFYEINDEIGKEQYLVPYLMSSHPGSTLADAIELALYLKKWGIRPRQVQDFYPTPGTISTAQYYTGIDPITMKKIFVPKSQEEKAMQRALLQYTKPENYNLVYKALIKAGREDLIGYSDKCLIKPRRNTNESKNFGRKGSFQKDKGRTEKRGGGTVAKRGKTGTRSNNR